MNGGIDPVLQMRDCEKRVGQPPLSGFRSFGSFGFAKSWKSFGFVKSLKSFGFVKFLKSFGFVKSLKSFGFVKSLMSFGFVKSLKSFGSLKSCKSFGLFKSFGSWPAQSLLFQGSILAAIQGAIHELSVLELSLNTSDRMHRRVVAAFW